MHLSKLASSALSLFVVSAVVACSGHAKEDVQGSGGQAVTSIDPTKLYEMANANSDLCVAGEGGGAGTAAVQSVCNGGLDQAWKFEPTASGTYTIVGLASNRCLAVSGSSTTDGASIVSWPCTGGAEQAWLPLVQSGMAGNRNVAGDYGLVNTASGKCLTIVQASIAGGAGLVQSDCSGGLEQDWNLLPPSSTPPPPPACVPSCANQACGAADGCGGLCAGYCSWGQECVSGACVCDANSCGSGCCSDNQCEVGNSTSACGTGGNECSTCGNGSSCSNGACSAPTCSPAGTYVGTDLNGAAQCCSHTNDGTSGVCEKGSAGSKCLSNNDCGGDTLCAASGTCAACTAGGAACTSASDCCSGSCTNGVCGCASQGASCASAGDCCWPSECASDNGGMTCQ